MRCSRPVNVVKAPGLAGGIYLLLVSTPRAGSAEAAEGRPSRIQDTAQFFDSPLAKIGSRPTSSQSPENEGAPGDKGEGRGEKFFCRFFFFGGLRSYIGCAIGSTAVSVLVTIGLAIEATMAERTTFLETRSLDRYFSESQEFVDELWLTAFAMARHPAHAHPVVARIRDAMTN